MNVSLINQITGEIKSQKIGWSWTCLFFSCVAIPLFVRQLYAWGVIMALITIVQIAVQDDEALWTVLTLSQAALAIALAAKANSMAGNRYLHHDWVFTEPNSMEARLAREKWGLMGPASVTTHG